jgi:hypothetical protein
VINKARLDPVNDLQKTKDWINRAYYDVVVETESIVNFATMALTANSFSYTLPAGVARIQTMFVVPAGQTATVAQQPPMRRTTLEDIERRRQLGQLVANSGTYSTHFCLRGATDFEVWPTPNAADVITIYYSAFPTALANNTDVPVLDEPYASNLLEYGALLHAGDFQGDPATDEWQANFDTWMGKYMAHLDAKAGDIPSQFHQWGSLQDTWEMYGGW